MSARHTSAAGGDLAGGLGLALTLIGTCRAPGCGAPLYAELLTPGAPRRCFDCAPAFLARRLSLGDLFARSGGRLPAGFDRGPRARAGRAGREGK